MSDAVLRAVRLRERVIKELDHAGARVRHFMIKWGETVSTTALVLMLLSMTFCGCASAPPCPEPDVIVDPQVVQVMVPATGEPLGVCEAPEYEVCDQAEILGRVKCLGRNHHRLAVCHQQNVDTITSHNQAVTDE